MIICRKYFWMIYKSKKSITQAIKIHIILLFDDLGMDSKVLSVVNHKVFYKQYLLTANTKELNSPLYGPRAINVDNVNLSATPTQDFLKDKLTMQTYR